MTEDQTGGFYRILGRDLVCLSGVDSGGLEVEISRNDITVHFLNRAETAVEVVVDFLSEMPFGGFEEHVRRVPGKIWRNHFARLEVCSASPLSLWVDKTLQPVTEAGGCFGLACFARNFEQQEVGANGPIEGHFLTGWSLSSGLSTSLPVNAEAQTDPRDLLRSLLLGGVTPIVRTEFASDEKWIGFLAKLDLDAGSCAPLRVCDSKTMRGFQVTDLLQLDLSVASGRLIVADDVESGSNSASVTFVELRSDDVRLFRCPISWIQSVEMNLSLGNLSFEDLRSQTGMDGVFQGFS